MVLGNFNINRYKEFSSNYTKLGILIHTIAHY